MSLSLAVLLFTNIALGARALVLREFEVPSHVALGSSAELHCQVDLAKESKLYSLKWYKDEAEFCRFTPRTQPTHQTFAVSGVPANHIKCGNISVELNDVSLTMSGTYKCEASSEAPDFQTVMSSRNMTVMAYPTNDPVITGVLPSYMDGEYIEANCTASASNPPPVLTWSINEAPADGFLTNEYTEAVDPGGLYKRTLALRVMAKKEIFTSDGRIVLLCTSIIAGLPPWQAIAKSRFRIVTPYLVSERDPAVNITALIEKIQNITTRQATDPSSVSASSSSACCGRNGASSFHPETGIILIFICSILLNCNALLGLRKKILRNGAEIKQE